MWDRILMGLLAVGCISLALALSLQRNPPSNPAPDRSRPAAIERGPIPTLSHAAIADEMLQRHLAEFKLDEGVTLEDAILTVSNISHSNIECTWSVLETVDVLRSSKLHFRISLWDVTVSRALETILTALEGEACLDFVGDEDTIIVSTCEALQLKTRTVVYGVRDIIDAIVARNSPGFRPSRQDAMDQLRSFIMDEVDPFVGWAEYGGVGSVSDPIADLFVVRQVPRNQDTIAALLHAIHDCIRTTPPGSFMLDEYRERVRTRFRYTVPQSQPLSR